MSDFSELTKAQMLFWAGQKLEPTAPLYNMAVNITIDGDLDPDRFEQALRKVIGNCDALMTVFEESRGMPQSRVDRDREWTLERVDLSTESAPQASALRWAEKRCRRVIPCDQLLFDAALIKVGNTRYVWYFNQHHLVTDAWSTSVLFKQVSEAYADPARRSDLPCFSDYITFEQAARGSSEYEQVSRHWQRKTVDRSSPPRLYGARNTQSSTISERIPIPFGRERSERLRELTIEGDVRCLTPHLSLFNIFSTLLFAYIYRISDQRELAIGAPAHNRPTLQFKETIGVFIELYPLTAEVSPSETFQSLLERLKLETGEFLRNARPGVSQPEYNRCFSTVLNYINVTFGTFAGMPAQTTWLHTGHSDRGHHLRLLVYDFDASGEFVLEFETSNEVFNEGLRSRMAGHFLSLVDAFLDDRHGTIDSVELLGVNERKGLREFGLSESIEIAPTRTLASEILQHAAAFPGRTAIVAPDGSMTYAELERVSRRIAEQLALHGVPRCSLIPIVSTASCAWVAAILGVLRHGSAYVPVDPLTPPERFRRILCDTQAKSVLVAGSNEVPCETDAQCIHLNDLIQLDQEPTLPVDYDHSTADSLAYVLYTSGSTGEPKGVCVSHAAVLNLITCSEGCQSLKVPSNCAIWTNVGFDVSVYEIFTALAYGHTLHVPAEKLRIDGETLFRYWQEHSIVSGYLPPFLLPTLDQWLNSNQWAAQRILVGVESIPHALLRSIARKSPGLRIINGYGPTEATVCSTFFVVDPDDEASDGPAPIGRPLANVTCRVLDEHRNLSPLGAVGELWISGAGLAAGYLNDSTLTADRFCYLKIDGEAIRAYRTGDAVKYHETGMLEFVGRMDQQLKIRGIRIEPSEIQAAVLSHPAIVECAIKGVATNGGEGLSELAAFVISQSPIETAMLRRHLRERLPDTVIPAYIIQIDSLPRTSGGKIDIAALPDPRLPDVGPVAQPDGPVEEIIRGIFVDLLEKPEIPVDLSFIQLGGDSLFAMRALVRIGQEFDLDLPLHTVFQAPSVREISQIVTTTLMAEIEALEEEEAERLAADI